MNTITPSTATEVQPHTARRKNGFSFWIGRVLLGLLALLIGLAALGASYEAIMAAGDATRYPPSGQRRPDRHQGG